MKNKNETKPLLTAENFRDLYTPAEWAALKLLTPNAAGSAAHQGRACGSNGGELKKSTQKRIAVFIGRANVAGSTATTLKGAGRYLIGVAAAKAPRFDRRSRERVAYYPYAPYRCENASALARQRITRESHEARLIARYSCRLGGLPKFLSKVDRAIIAGSLADKTFRERRALPLCARALYDNGCLARIPRLAKTLAAWEAGKGKLISNGGVADIAFGQADWGRLRKIHNGSTTLHPGIRTETNGKGGWDKVSDHYADYTLIVPAAPRYALGHYVGPDHVARKLLVAPHFLSLAGEIVPRKFSAVEPKPIKVRHAIRRLARFHVAAEYDRTAKLVAIRSGDELFHLPALTDSVWRAKSVGQLVRNAIKQLRKRRDEQIALADFAARAAHSFVSIEDSLAAGNCAPLTERFAAQVWRDLGAAGPCAVRGDIVLAARDDNYTRRAVAQAINRAVAQ